jgi:hypothetical protein
MLDKPNLCWGSESFTKLGCYEYGSNTVTVSRIFEQDEELLDYIMYHELLHKKHKFSTRNNRSYHHTTHFRRKEKEFDNPRIEEKLKKFLAKKRVRKAFTPKSKGWFLRFF